MAEVDAPALLQDSRRYELGVAELRPRLGKAIERAFGGRAREDGDGWVLHRARRGVSHEVRIALHERGHESEVAISVAVEHTGSSRLALIGIFAVTLVTWIAAAALTFSDMRGAQDPGRVAAWFVALVAAFAMTGASGFLIKQTRVDATGALHPIEQLWAALDELEAAPKVTRGYRVAPELLKGAEEDVEAQAEAEAEAEVEAQKAKTPT